MQQLRGRPWSWITGRPRLIDALVVGLNLVFGTLGVAAAYFRSGSVAVASILLVVGQALPLWWRRRFPLTVLLIIVLEQAAAWAFGLPNNLAGGPLIFAVYAVSTGARAAARLLVGGAAIAVIVLAVAMLLAGVITTGRDLIPIGAVSLVAWVIGDYVRGRRLHFAAFMEGLRRQGEAARQQAVEGERLRIARELHDVVAHNVSVMAIQAGAARVSGNSSREALQSIETTARDTLMELNRLLGVLRKEPGTADRDPQPGLDQIDHLLKPAREAGIEPKLVIKGQPRALPAALDLSAYRIVQEAVTNVLKHSQATRLEVTVDYEPSKLVLAISDNGIGSEEKAGATTGHGLIGMRERVALFGGEIAMDSSSLGGFSVRAKLPLAPSGKGEDEGAQLPWRSE